MRILVTGGAGFIGSHVVDAYVEAGHEVAVIDNLSTGRRSHVNPAARLHDIDVHSREAERVVADFQPEVINHHAAQASVTVSNDDPVGDLEVNAGGTARMVDLAARHGVRKFIYASSGGTVYGEPTALPVSEEHGIAPVSPYGLSKYAGELYVQLFARTAGMDSTILRYGNAYGPRQDPRGEAGVVAIFAGRMLAGEACTIDGDGEQQKDYVFVGDIAHANVVALGAGAQQTLNIGSGVGTSVNAIHSALAAITRSTEPARHGPPRKGDVRRFWLDSTRAREVLGWKAETELEAGLATTVGWLLVNR